MTISKFIEDLNLSTYLNEEVFIVCYNKKLMSYCYERYIRIKEPIFFSDTRAGISSLTTSSR